MTSSRDNLRLEGMIRAVVAPAAQVARWWMAREQRELVHEQEAQR